MLPNQPLTKAISGIDLFESLNELEILVDGKALRVNYAVNHLPTELEGMSTYDQDREGDETQQK